MAGGNFMHRVVSYLVNGVANSPTFQRLAVRTSKRLEEMSNVAAQTKREITEKMKDMIEDIESRRNR